jgi:glycine cleavage system aminomethyltransferase T
MGRPLRAGGAALADQRLMTQRLADRPLKNITTEGEQAYKDRESLKQIADVVVEVLIPGAHLRLPGTEEGSDGWITSASHSPALGKPIALALLRSGHRRLGETIFVHDLDRKAEATVVTPKFLDPEGKRLHA